MTYLKPVSGTAWLPPRRTRLKQEWESFTSTSVALGLFQDDARINGKECTVSWENLATLQSLDIAENGYEIFQLPRIDFMKVRGTSLGGT